MLVSGGVDSTTVATLARREGYELSAVTVHYGQSHRRELDSAARVAQALDLRHRVADVSFFKELAWYSALTQPDRFSLPADRSPADMEADIPITYVPLRNSFLITMAAALLESEALRRGSKLGMQYGVPVKIETPIIHLSKAEIVRLAVEVGAPLDLTWSCYAGGDHPCGRCDSCVLREKGFREAGVADPALVPAVAG